MTTTKWVNLSIIGGIAEYVNISGFCGTGIPSVREDRIENLVGFKGLAAISIDEYRCSDESCIAFKEQLRIEGMIPDEEDPSLEYVEAHLYARTSMCRHKGEGEMFRDLTGWSGKLTGVISGKSIEVRHTPPPPGYPVLIREGQTLMTWAKPGPELPCNVIDEYLCPYCAGREIAKETVLAAKMIVGESAVDNF